MNRDTMTLFPEITTGKLFLVPGLHGGREVFLGRALGEPRDGVLGLEGRVLSMTPGGQMIVRPFSTTLNASLWENSTPVQYLSDARAAEEAAGLLELSATHVSRSSYPSIVRWVESAVHSIESEPHRALGELRAIEPSTGLQLEFLATAEELRRVLLRARRVESTRELDHVVELEGNLSIEVGKITNRTAVRLHEILGRERELAHHVEMLQDDGPTDVRGATGGWPLLFQLLQTSKTWARRQGKAELVRALNTLIRDAVHGLDEVVLEHQNVLDTLITEAFGQYGLAEELVGEGGLHELSVEEVGPVGGMLVPAGVPAR